MTNKAKKSAKPIPGNQPKSNQKTNNSMTVGFNQLGFPLQRLIPTIENTIMNTHNSN